MLIFLQSFIHYFYFVLDAVILYYFIKHLFKRKKKLNLVYDIVYVYCCIPFLLRMLFIK
jgi:hypothetical protein